MNIMEEILELVGGKEIVTFPTRTSAMFNSPIAREIGEYLFSKGYEVTVIDLHLIEWELDDLQTGRDPRD